MPILPVRRSILCAAAVLSAGCATATQQAYVAPTSETIVSSTEERTTDPPSHIIIVENRSTVPVTIFSVSLRGCENVRQRCDPQGMNLNVAPGSRVVAMRIEPANPHQGFTYNFSFSWRADSSNIAATAALASAGDEKSRQTLASIAHADSIRRLDTGPSFHELTRDDFASIGPRASRIVMMPESLVVEPGERIGLEHIKALVVDQQGNVLGQTRWMRWNAPGQSSLQPVTDGFLARAPGRVLVRFKLADEAEQLLKHALNERDVPVVIEYKPDVHAPVFAGRALDADSKTPLTCASVALEDSAQNIVARAHTGMDGAFVLSSPRSGTYRVRVEARGWSPSVSPSVTAKPDSEVQSNYLVRFTEQLLMSRENANADVRHAQPIAVAAPPTGARPAGRGAVAATPIQSVSLGGPETSPILGIIGRVAPGSMFVQFTVDSLGRVDSTSVLVPADAPANAKPTITSALARVRFLPAMDAGAPVCEMLRMRVDLRAP